MPFFWNQFNYVSNKWFAPSYSTPDLFTTDSLLLLREPLKKYKSKIVIDPYWNAANVAPYVFGGYQNPRTGKNMAGFVAYNYTKNAAIEMLSIKLKRELEKGKRYCFKLYLNLPDSSQYYGSNIGIKLFTEEDFKRDNINMKLDKKLKSNPSIIINLTSFVDTLNWVPFQSSYTATGGELYISIGGIHDAPSGKLYNKTKINNCYYFIDDVSLIEQSDTNQCICKKVAPDTILKKPVEPVIITEKPYIIPNLNFDTDSWDIKPEAYPTLDSLVQTIINLKGYKIEISGHTDDVGGDARNLHLSQNRAKSVTEYLIGKGINKNSITYKGYGETMPLNPAQTEQARAQNRRVEIKLIKE